MSGRSARRYQPRIRSPRPAVGWCAAVLLGTLVCIARPVASTESTAARPGVATRGPVSAELSLSNPEATLGATVTLTLKVQAEAQVELLMPEFGESLGRFAILDFAPGTTINPDGSTTAIQRYELLLERSGKQHVPPLLIEFVDRRDGATPAPPGEDAYELLTEPLRFEVAIPDAGAGELSGPLGALAPRSFIEREPATAGGLAALALALLGAITFAVWRWRQRPETPASAYERALGALAALSERGVQGDVDRFFVDLSGLLRRYVEGRFGLHAPELTTEEFLAAARDAPELTLSDREFLGDFLQMADRVKFAGFTPDDAGMDAALEAVRRFVERTGVEPATRPQRGDAGGPVPGGARHA